MFNRRLKQRVAVLESQVTRLIKTTCTHTEVKYATYYNTKTDKKPNTHRMYFLECTTCGAVLKEFETKKEMLLYQAENCTI